MRRLGIVISHPIQHFVPLFVQLAARRDLEIKVFYCCDWGVKEYMDPGFGKSFAWDIPLLEGYEYEFLPIRSRPTKLGYWDIDNPSVARTLNSFSPQYVWVHGYSHRTSWRVMKWAQGRARILYFGDSELLSQRSLVARSLKRLVLPGFFRRCDGFLTIGDNNEAYYRRYGVPDDKMHRGAFPIDVQRFRRAISGLSEGDRASERGRLGLDAESVVVLFVGKFIAIKRPFDFVSAIAELRALGYHVQGLMIGSGPLAESVKGMVKSLNVADGVKLAGFINQSDIPRVLWTGDVIAMCSEKDPHPLAVSEAMAVGNAVVASDRVGCVGETDAARPGQNAISYRCGDVSGLVSSIRALLDDKKLRDRMRAESLSLAETQDVSVAVRGICEFMDTV